MRLFIAVKLPEKTRSALVRLRCDIPGARWVPAEQIHLTLAFLGDVDDEGVARLTDRLSRINASPFTLRFGGSGCFPDRRRPRVLWVGLEHESRLLDLAAKVHVAVKDCGIVLEERPFSPHITLARIKVPKPMEADIFLDRHIQNKLPSLVVREFILFQSRLTREGAIHTPVRSFPLTVDPR